MDSYIMAHTNKKGVKVVERVFDDGTREILSGPPGPRQGIAQWDRWCDNYGCHPKQVPELKKLLKSRGVRDTHFDKTGRCRVQSKAHGKEMLRARGMIDLNAGLTG